MSIVREIRDLMSRVSRVEQQVSKLPSRISSAVGGSGTSNSIWTTAPSKAELDNDSVAETLLGRVTDGAQKGMVCVRNPENDGWVSINFWDD
jgi:hypothetical protein